MCVRLLLAFEERLSPFFFFFGFGLVFKVLFVCLERCSLSVTSQLRDFERCFDLKFKM